MALAAVDENFFVEIEQEAEAALPPRNSLPLHDYYSTVLPALKEAAAASEKGCWEGRRALVQAYQAHYQYVFVAVALSDHIAFPPPDNPPPHHNRLVTSVVPEMLTCLETIKSTLLPPARHTSARSVVANQPPVVAQVEPMVQKAPSRKMVTQSQKYGPIFHAREASSSGGCLAVGSFVVLKGLVADTSFNGSRMKVMSINPDGTVVGVVKGKNVAVSPPNFDLVHDSPPRAAPVVQVKNTHPLPSQQHQQQQQHQHTAHHQQQLSRVRDQLAREAIPSSALSATSAPNTHLPSHCGVLHKRGAVNTAFQRRIFILSDGTISYYKCFSFWDKHADRMLAVSAVQEALSRSPDQRCGTVALTSLWSVRAIRPGDRDFSATHPFSFTFQGPNAGDRVYRVKADTLTEADAWVNAIRRTLDLLDNRGQPRAGVAMGVQAPAKQPGRISADSLPDDVAVAVSIQQQQQQQQQQQRPPVHEAAVAGVGSHAAFSQDPLGVTGAVSDTPGAAFASEATEGVFII